MSRDEGHDGDTLSLLDAAVGDLTGDGLADACPPDTLVLCEAGPLSGGDAAVDSFLVAVGGYGASDLGDLTGDGIDDRVTEYAVFEGGVSDLSGSGAFWGIFDDGVYSARAGADIDGDGAGDLTGLTADGADGTAVVVLGPLPEGRVDVGSAEYSFDLTGLTAGQVRAGGEMNQDGHYDLFLSVLASGDWKLLAFLGGRGPGAWNVNDAEANVADSAGGKVGYGGAGLADLDGDGVGDLVAPTVMWVFYGSGW